MKNNRNIFFFYPEVKEGQTRKVIAGIFNPETNTLKIGKSECSVKDRFNKVKGRAIALGRANCDRPLKEKIFMQKGQVIKTNKDLLPVVIELGTNDLPLHQFINIAKSL